MNALTLYRNATKRLQRHQKGFTLIELLVVIGILAVLLAIVLIAINPAKQFEQANDTKRASDANAILNAIHQYGADNRGNLSALGLGTTAEEITSTNTAGLCAALVPEYMAALPVAPEVNSGDPIEASECATYTETGYTVFSSATDNRITVASEANAEITVTR